LLQREREIERGRERGECVLRLDGKRSKQNVTIFGHKSFCCRKKE
jgi:hypothetical protein